LGSCVLGLALPGLVGCGSPEETSHAFDKLEDVRVWATAGSAVGVYANVYQLIAVADGHETFPDARCPAVSDDGTTLTATGGCRDSDGHDWRGQATVTRDGDDLSLALDDFDGNQGTFTLGTVPPVSRRRFEAHLRLGTVTTIDYVGDVTGDYDQPTHWNGTGTVKREGVLPPIGTVDVTTLEEVVDDAVCAGQPTAGATVLKAGSETATISYDGADDCDSKQNAQLRVNGEDRGLIDGISCAVRAPGALTVGRASGALVLLALGLAQLRRRSRPTTWRVARPCAAPLSRSATCRCKA
jgi:hypothetical protein